MKNYFMDTFFKRFLLAGLSLFLFNGALYAGSANLAWNASTSSNVAGYTVSYSQSSGKNTGIYTSSIDAGKATTTKVSGLNAGTTYYFAVKAYGSNKTTTSGYSNEISMAIPATPVATPSPTPASNILKVDFTASKTSGAPGMVVNFTPVTSGTVTSWKWNFTGSSTPSVTNTTAKVVSVTYPNPGTFSVSLTASGPGGSAAKSRTNLITVAAVSPAPTSIPAPTPGSVTIKNGLVAAYGFEESSGTTVLDSSGNGNHGTIREAVRINTPSKYGKTLKFDGINDWVTVNDSASLDFTTGMTLEAWVHPQDLTGFGKTVITKEQVGGAVYNLYANEDSNLPIASFNDGGYRVISGLKQIPVNQPTHLATTYDKQYLRLYVNGVEVSKQRHRGVIRQSSGMLRIGGNSIWGEFFEGYIDEVRIYNRALTATEIASDLVTPIGKGK
ncbi:MAG: LamG-like jellyroll fold domain-containing protein [Methylococcales bacterium]